jgi:hypothetical protein
VLVQRLAKTRTFKQGMMHELLIGKTCWNESRDINGRDYRLPGGLNEFQLRLYVHLIDWKWAHITDELGNCEYQGRQIPYDAILPREMIDELRVIYPPMVDELRRHRKENRFRLHTHFNHMASSQAANVNLFLPVLYHPLGSKVLALLKPGFASLATEHLDHGYCLEFWGGNFGADKSDRGPLGDKSARGGTDSDIAIAYRDHAGALCLWLIEHKLAEDEFTPCGGYKSKGRKEHRSCDCTRSFSEILENKNTCYHHDVLHRNYWSITEKICDFFVNHARHAECPFQEGMNQLWRNQLLAQAVEQDERQPYDHASFSVVKHPANPHLDGSLNAFRDLVGNNPKFAVFTSEDVLRASEALQDDALNQWARWYRTLYML